MPEGLAGVGSYVYDPNLGDLTVKMVETNDRAQGFPCCYWYDDGEMVTRFDGIVVATPEPGSMLLMASGLAGLAGVYKRRRRAS
jgi:hypothetical protein